MTRSTGAAAARRVSAWGKTSFRTPPVCHGFDGGEAAMFPMLLLASLAGTLVRSYPDPSPKSCLGSH